MSVSDVFKTLISVRGYQGELDKDLYEAYGIEEFAGKRTGALSGGMRQKVNAALAFLFNPDILILDEPTASLDPLSQYPQGEDKEGEGQTRVYYQSYP